MTKPTLRTTHRFSVFDTTEAAVASNPGASHHIILAINSDYTARCICKALRYRPHCVVHLIDPDDSADDCEANLESWISQLSAHIQLHHHHYHQNKTGSDREQSAKIMQICDFENTDWSSVMNSGMSGASSYLVRKGLSRKAQLSLQLRRYISKHPESILKSATPFTLSLETWSAFEDSIRFDIGGGALAEFDASSSSILGQVPFSQKLDWCLSDARDIVHEKSGVLAYTTTTATTTTNSCDLYLEQKLVEKKEENIEKLPWKWILKPSVTNKGADTSIHTHWEGENGILAAVESLPHVREFVLQRYLENPLLVHSGKHKFHLRVYVLCVGALHVFVYEGILMLLAAHSYDADDLKDIHRHLTNTARAVEAADFDETKFVQLLSDLPSHLVNDNRASSLSVGKDIENSIRAQIRAITGDLFAAFENEYSIFCPMSQCFEIFGLDFLVDDAFSVSLLEVNPGPDFKQTGDRLSGIISNLWEQTLAIVVDLDLLRQNGFAKHRSQQSTRASCLIEMTKSARNALNSTPKGVNISLSGQREKEKAQEKHREIGVEMGKQGQQGESNGCADLRSSLEQHLKGEEGEKEEKEEEKCMSRALFPPPDILSLENLVGNMSLVYSKEWSVAQMKSSMRFQ